MKTKIYKNLDGCKIESGGTPGGRGGEWDHSVGPMASCPTMLPRGFSLGEIFCIIQYLVYQNLSKSK